MDSIKLEDLSFNKDGLITAVLQDAHEGDVLMLAWMNQESLEKSLNTGYAHFYSRSRQALWMKGESSGNTMRIVSIKPDCDRDALLVLVEPQGDKLACHRGIRSCFSEELKGLSHEGETLVQTNEHSCCQHGHEHSFEHGGDHEHTCGGHANGHPGFGKVMKALEQTIESRVGANPEESYTAKLLNPESDLVLKKIGEEATEVVMAAKDGDTDHLRYEAGDLLYHLVVLCKREGISLNDLGAELFKRFK